MLTINVSKNAYYVMYSEYSECIWNAQEKNFFDKKWNNLIETFPSIFKRVFFVFCCFIKLFLIKALDIKNRIQNLKSKFVFYIEYKILAIDIMEGKGDTES